MRRFFKTIIYGALVLYVINFGIDILVSQQLQTSKDRRYVGWNEISHNKINADIVIMGSSRAWIQYNPSIIDSILNIKVYNLGIDGSELNRQIVKYDVYNHYQQKKPQCIIVNVDYMSTLGYTYGYEREQYFPYLLSPYMRSQIERVEPFNWMELYVPLYRYSTYKGLFAVWNERNNNGGLVDGYKGIDRDWDAPEYAELDSYHFVKSDTTLQMFNDFLNDRKNEQIQVVFCFAPIYIGMTLKVDNLQEAYAIYQDLSDKYDIPILDYTYSSLSMDTAYFYNATHLTKYGSELFSTQLAHDLDSLGVR